MKDSTYWWIVRLLDALLWGGELVGETTFSERPLVFVSNHLGAIGPIAVVSSLPLRVYPWIVSDMLEKDKAAAYLCHDFVEPQLHLHPPLSRWVAKSIARISVNLLASAGCIPVWQGERIQETFAQSVKLLTEGKSLLIFPEDSTRSIDPFYKMTPFYKGFVRLGEIYFEQTNHALAFCPLAVHLDSYRVQAGCPIAYNSMNPPAIERLRIKHLLEASIRAMYQEMGPNGFSGISIHY